jgi:FkbM family methyltransferase|uniref:Methyltransferase FkbM domain-containing protein n=1 Tax=viral metagenome TaxID=1070528 RepID=A0A6C0CLA0_9ZZZZ
MSSFNLKISGILHVGAHECEELKDYVKYNINPQQIYWVEAMEHKVLLMKAQNIPNIYQAIIDEVDDKEITFNVANNGQSSSLLEFGTHTIHHPHVKFTGNIQGKTKRLDTLIEENNIPIQHLNFLNFDIQGVELRALKSMEKYLSHVDYIYTEINTDYVYKDCNLVGEIDEYLKKFGFTRVATKIASNFGWGDAFYIKQ